MTSAPRIPRHRPMFSDTVPAPRCSGPCQQGRRACPTPDACRRPDDSGLPGPAMALAIAIGLIAVIATVSLVLGQITQP